MSGKVTLTAEYIITVGCKLNEDEYKKAKKACGKHGMSIELFLYSCIDSLINGDLQISDR